MPPDQHTEIQHLEPEKPKRIRGPYKKKEPITSTSSVHAPLLEIQQDVINIIRDIRTRYRIDPDEGKLYAISSKGNSELEQRYHTRSKGSNTIPYYTLKTPKTKDLKPRRIRIYANILMWICKNGYVPAQSRVENIDGDLYNFKVSNLRLIDVLPSPEAMELRIKKGVSTYKRKVGRKEAVAIRNLLKHEPDITVYEIVKRIQCAQSSVRAAVERIKNGEALKCETVQSKVTGKREKRKIAWSPRVSTWVYKLRPSDVFMIIE